MPCRSRSEFVAFQQNDIFHAEFRQMVERVAADTASTFLQVFNNISTILCQ